MKEIVDLTTENEETYNSDSIRKFTWSEDPKDSQGLLFIEYVSDSAYVYYDVPESIYVTMRELSDRGLQSREFPDQTAGEFVQKSVVPVYDERGEDYDRLKDILEDH